MPINDSRTCKSAHDRVKSNRIERNKIGGKVFTNLYN